MAKAAIAGFDLTPLSFRGKCRAVLISQSGCRPIILMHELFGLTDSVLTFARRLVAAGHRIYLPVMFGSSDPTDPQPSRLLAMPCIVAEFRVLSSNEPGPWANWIRDLAGHAFQACDGIPGKGVGVIGLCLTGNLALSAALSPVVTASVMSEPSLPFTSAGGLHVSEAELQKVKMRVHDEALVIRGYRYELDKLCKAKRFQDLEAALGDGFNGTTIPTTDKSLHSVFTEHYLGPGEQPRHGEFETLLDYLGPRV